MKESPEEIPDEELHVLLTEVDTNKNGLVELDEVSLSFAIFVFFSSLFNNLVN